MRLKQMVAVAVGATIGVTTGTVGLSAAPASAGAVVIKCEAVFPYLTGVIIFGPGHGSTFTGNCHQHDYAPGPPTVVEGSAYTVSCDLGLPDFPPDYTYGVQVITPAGNVLTNCVVHSWPAVKP